MATVTPMMAAVCNDHHLAEGRRRLPKGQPRPGYQYGKC
jgi:hypothetical protein